MKPQDRTRTILRSGLDPESKLVAIAIADYLSDDNGRAWPSMSRLSRDTGLTTRTLRRRVAVAVADGWLDTQRRSGDSTRYAVAWSSPALAPVAVTPDSLSTRTACPPGQGVHPTPDTESTHPGQGVHPTPDSLSTEVDQWKWTNDPTIERDHSARTTQPQPEQASMSRPDDLDAAADGYRSGRTGPNLSDPPPPERSGVIAPDGREVPATWAELLRPLALAAMPREASRLGELCRRLRALDADPVDLLRIPADEWRYVRGLGPVDAGRLADLATRAGWPPGLLVVAPIRKMTESEALDAITGEESQRWQDGGCKRDPITGACIVPPLLTLLEGGP